MTEEKTTEEIIIKNVKIIEDYFESKSWNYTKANSNMFILSFGGDSFTNFNLITFVDEDFFVIDCVIPNKIQDNTKENIHEFILLLNFPLKFGHFNINEENKTIGFRTTSIFVNDIDQEYINFVFENTIDSFENFSLYILNVLNGADPHEKYKEIFGF